ncbi:MAG: phosphotransferase [Actinomycetota bacterium]|nr:phosphotransferase [Actinomycetota bacterium]
MIDKSVLSSLLIRHLPQQRWFGAKDQILQEVEIGVLEVVRDEWPIMLSAEVEAVMEDDSDDLYHVLVGIRPYGEHAQFLEGQVSGVIGDLDTDLGPGYAYDAARDPELAIALFRHISPDVEPPKRARGVGTEQSNTSLVFDDEIIMKIFRRLSEGTNSDVEVTRALAAVGFKHVAEPLGEWQRGGIDLAIMQTYLAGGSEGWALALTSLRDLYDQRLEPSEAGGDFAAEAERLGQMTAELHDAMRRAFDQEPADPAVWSELMLTQLEGVSHPEIDKRAIAKVFEDLKHVDDAGPSMRVHGDYHLGQVMRTDMGWHVLDFEGEPARPFEQRRMPSSPLKDVAGMLRSLQYATWGALTDPEQRPVGLGAAWEARNRQAFLDGYVAIAHGLGGILPSDRDSMDAILRAFELDKAVYEVNYEMANRPGWVQIPIAAINRVTS